MENIYILFSFYGSFNASDDLQQTDMEMLDKNKNLFSMLGQKYKQ